MYRSLFSVGGMTLISRATGFLRDVMLGAMLGAGALADAFYVAFRLPNHFRTIFGEGAFNAAYVPSYAQVLESEGAGAAKSFANHILTLLLISQLIFLAFAFMFMPTLVRWLAPGFDADPAQFDMAVMLTRITFPYLLCMTLVTLHSGTLNAHRHFAAAAFAPVLLNVVMIIALALSFLFPNAAVAAAWGVVVSGAAQLALVMYAAWRASILAHADIPHFDHHVRRFFAHLMPAVIGSAGVQIAMFADTIIASLLPTGSVSAIYYADRLYQLPIGVIGIAAGTVLLPEMARRFAAQDEQGAFRAQNHTIALTAVLSAPFIVAFVMMPELIMQAVFMRGAFTYEAARASAAVLAAYGIGLPAVVLIRSSVASFQAKGDTRTPMMISLGAVALNVLLKIALYESLGAAGLALATACGAWLNFGALTWLAIARQSMRPDHALRKVMASVAASSLILALFAWAAQKPFAQAIMGVTHFYPHEITLCVLGVCGAALYAGSLIISLRMMGVRWRGAEAL
jgi:putative peptidoglycan lipid II flippase